MRKRFEYQESEERIKRELEAEARHRAFLYALMFGGMLGWAILWIVWRALK